MWWNKKNYNIGAEIESINIDFLEQLSRSVSDTTVSKVVLKPKSEEIPNYWLDFLNDINENNSLERLVKTDVRYKSMYGKSYVGFDMYLENEKYWPILWIAENDARNTCLRFNGMKPFSVRVKRTYANVAMGSPILTNEVVYTKNDANYLFLGGFGLGNISLGSSSLINQERAQELFDKSQTAAIPFDWVMLKTPDYILQNHKMGRHEHNYGVIPVQEFLNKDVADYTTDDYLSDWYPAREYIPLIDAYLKYIAWEMNLDHTRIMGLFSSQDMSKMNQTATRIASDPRNFSRNLRTLLERDVMDVLFQQNNGTDALINQKLIVKAPGGQGSVLDKMNSTFDGEKHVNGLQKLISLIYKICGYSWAVEDSTSTYENVEQTQQTLRSVFETTKEKVNLFNRQWKGLLADMAYAYFRVNKINMLSNKEVREEFEKYIEFLIVSNIIVNETSDWRRTMELHNNKLISTKKAIETINPEWSKAEIEKEIERIKQNTQQQGFFNDFNAFENTKFREEKNPVDSKGE